MIGAVCDKKRDKAPSAILTDFEWIVFDYIKSQAVDGVAKDLTNAKLATACGSTIESIQRATNNLAHKGFVKKTPDFYPHGGQRGHKYTITKRSKSYDKR